MPNYDKLFSQAQNALRAGEQRTALSLLDKCSKAKQYRLRCLKMMGSIHAQLAEYENAVSCFQKASSIDPNDHELMFYLAMAMVFADRVQDETLEVFEQSIQLNPGYSEAWYGAGNLYRDMGLYDKAKEYLKKSIETNPGHINARLSLATIRRDEGDFDTSLTEFDECISIQPQNIEALAGKAITQFCHGDIDESEREISRLASIYRNNRVIAAAYVEICKSGDLANDALDYVERTLTETHYAPMEEKDLRKAAAKLCDKLGLYDRAYDHSKIANDLLSRRFDMASYLAYLPLRQLAAKQKTAPLQISQSKESVIPVFILGMPRSGSTLTEQVLSCHPDVSVGGELTDLYTSVSDALVAEGAADITQLHIDVLQSIRKKYLDQLEGIANGRRFVTDKLPGNYETIGWITALFPEAKIINTVRNRLDVCISCFFQNFGMRHIYVCNMDTLIATYRFYEDIIDHWRSENDIDIYDVNYENLVNNARDEISGLLSHVGLNWNDACLVPHKSSNIAKTASFDQVRQPLYQTSVHRWKNYSIHIPELLEAFGPEG